MVKVDRLVCKAIPFSMKAFSNIIPIVSIDSRDFVSIKLDFKRGDKIGQLELVLTDSNLEYLGKEIQKYFKHKTKSSGGIK